MLGKKLYTCIKILCLLSDSWPMNKRLKDNTGSMGDCTLGTAGLWPVAIVVVRLLYCTGFL